MEWKAFNPRFCVVVIELPGVIHVTRNRFYKVQTTRSWDYLGLSSTSLSNLLNKSKMGNGVIIGLLDTGLLLVSTTHPCLYCETATD